LTSNSSPSASLAVPRTRPDEWLQPVQDPQRLPKRSQLGRAALALAWHLARSGV